MSSLAPFTPVAATKSISVTTSSARVVRTKTTASQVRIAAPAGGQIAFINFGDVTVTAAVTDTPILPGTVEVFTVPNNGTSWTYVAAITGSSTQTLYITDGEGQ